jgi:hypothetical protein
VKTSGTRFRQLMARPSHKPTAASRRRVSIAAGGGMTHEAIAQALSLSKPTLEKHYSVELATGANMRRIDVLEKLFQSARKGSTSAARAYLHHTPEFIPIGEGGVAAPKPEPEAKLGKKEQATADAVGAESGTGWDGVLPKNVVSIR